jgi:hypothetical protein
MDADGYFRIVDRKKDMVVVSGFNVYPNEIEDCLATHPGIARIRRDRRARRRVRRGGEGLRRPPRCGSDVRRTSGPLQGT